MVFSRTSAAAAGCWLMLLSLLPSAAAAQLAAAPGERLSDRDVKQIIDAVDQARDRFEAQLDGKLKSSILRGPRGETNVAAYLDDLQENVKRLKDRFKPEYSASKEAETILRQGADIHTFVKAQPGELKGGSEWDRMAAELGRLAAAYGTTFPLPANAAVRRVNDVEAAATAEDVARGADLLKRQLDREAALVTASREAIKEDLDTLIRLARTVKSRTSGGRPVTAEMRDLMIMAGKVGTLLQANTVGPQTTSAWEAMQAPVDKLLQIFDTR